MLENIISFIYPNTCIICGKKLKQIESYACTNCFSILKYKMYRETKITLDKCYFEKLICSFWYEGIVRKKMLDFKFLGRSYLGKQFAKAMVKDASLINLQDFIIIPVPIHKKRFFERGYNQSAILAKNISKILKIKYASNILTKIKHNSKQSMLKHIERCQNVKDVYKIKNIKNLQGQKILLVDDIYTTGATVNECAKVLKEHGATKVYVIVAARARLQGGVRWTN